MIELILTLAAIGLVAWLVTTLVPMPAQIKTVIIVVACVFCLLVVLRAFGVADIGVPRLR